MLRLEYKLEVDYADGGTEWICDPGNPKRAPGAFGEKSVLELPGYEPPAWLEAETVEGRFDEALGPRPRPRRERRRSGSGARPTPSPGRPLRMLLANDGPEYDALSQLTRFSAAMIAAGELPPHRVALLAPGDRNQWYSASAAYARVLAHDIVPALRDAFGIDRRARGDGREPRRAGDAARPAPLPARVRRAVPAVRRASSCRATTRTSSGFGRYAPDHPLRPRDAARRAVRDARPGDASPSAARRRTRTTTAKWRVPWPLRGTRCPWRRCPTCTTTSAGGTPSTRI